MDIIYKGATYELLVDSPTQLDKSQCNLFNISTLSRLQLSATETTTTKTDEETGEEKTVYSYTLTLGKERTESACVGMYDLELYSIDGSMCTYIKNFAKVVPSSKGKN